MIAQITFRVFVVSMLNLKVDLLFEWIMDGAIHLVTNAEISVTWSTPWLTI